MQVHGSFACISIMTYFVIEKLKEAKKQNEPEIPRGSSNLPGKMARISMYNIIYNPTQRAERDTAQEQTKNLLATCLEQIWLERKHI